MSVILSVNIRRAMVLVSHKECRCQAYIQVGLAHGA